MNVTNLNIFKNTYWLRAMARSPILPVIEKFTVNVEIRLGTSVIVVGTTRGDSPSNLTNWEEDLDKLKGDWMEKYVSTSCRAVTPTHCSNPEISEAVLRTPIKRASKRAPT